MRNFVTGIVLLLTVGGLCLGFAEGLAASCGESLLCQSGYRSFK